MYVYKFIKIHIDKMETFKILMFDSETYKFNVLTMYEQVLCYSETCTIITAMFSIMEYSYGHYRFKTN